MASSTVTGNSAASGANLFDDVDGSMTIRNTIVADPAGSGDNCLGVTSAGFNYSNDLELRPERHDRLHR